MFCNFRLAHQLKHIIFLRYIKVDDNLSTSFHTEGEELPDLHLERAVLVFAGKFDEDTPINYDT